jgi:hypothetical protein
MEGSKTEGVQQLLVCGDNVNSLCENMNAIKKVNLEVRAEETECMLKVH